MIGIDTTFLVDLEIMESPRHQKVVELFSNWKGYNFLARQQKLLPLLHFSSLKWDLQLFLFYNQHSSHCNFTATSVFLHSVNAKLFGKAKGRKKLKRYTTVLSLGF